MINDAGHRCALDASLAVWAFAKWVFFQVTSSSLLPRITVSPRACRLLATAPSACWRPRQRSKAAAQRTNRRFECRDAHVLYVSFLFVQFSISGKCKVSSFGPKSQTCKPSYMLGVICTPCFLQTSRKACRKLLNSSSFIISTP
jgi:hypothetical protein